MHRYIVTFKHTDRDIGSEFTVTVVADDRAKAIEKASAQALALGVKIRDYTIHATLIGEGANDAE